MNELDVDSIGLPICTQELFKWHAISLVELLATPQAVKDVSGAVCVGRMGYRIWDNQKKLELCARITVAGVLIMPHTADTILCTGHNITIGLHTLTRCLLQCGITSVTFVGYGMKSPYRDLIELRGLTLPLLVLFAGMILGEW